MHEGFTCTSTIVKPNTLLYKDGCLRILGWQWHKINMTTIPGYFFPIFCKLVTVEQYERSQGDPILHTLDACSHPKPKTC